MKQYKYNVIFRDEFGPGETNITVENLILNKHEHVLVESISKQFQLSDASSVSIIKFQLISEEDMSISACRLEELLKYALSSLDTRCKFEEGFKKYCICCLGMTDNEFSKVYKEGI